MPYDRNKHHRRSIRLPGYDYTSTGAYFITLCVRGGECLLGEVVDGEMQLNEWGRIAHEEWRASEEIRHELKLDAFVVMPNHLHGIVWIIPDEAEGAHSRGAHRRAPLQEEHGRGAHRRAPLQEEHGWGAHRRAPLQEEHGRGAHRRVPLQRAPRSLGSFVAGYKATVTKRINELRDMPGVPFWQRNYWEHIVRNEAALDRIREYIQSNPARWVEDQLHPAAPPNAFNQWQS